MHDGDNLNRLASPGIADNVGVEVPKAIAPVQEFLVIVTNSGRLAQALKGFINLGSDALRDIGAVFSDIEKNVAQVGFCVRGKDEAPLH
jgi:hypothetical protein